MTSLRHVSLIENTCAFLFLKLFYFWNIYFVSEQSWLVKIIQSMYTSAKSHIMTLGQKVETAEAAYGRDSTPVVPTSPNTQFQECFAGGKNVRKSSGSWIFVIPSLQRVPLTVRICVKSHSRAWSLPGFWKWPSAFSRFTDFSPSPRRL